MSLNEKQLEAVMHTEGPLLILAGAGSGKTNTMTHRIAYMIQEKHINPFNILAVTFTNKAAGEMRDRVEALVGASANMWILTFHSACLRILRNHAEVLGYGRDFAVYDPKDQKTVVKSVCRQLSINEKIHKPEVFMSEISACKEKRLSPKAYLMASAGDEFARLVSEVFELYQKTLKKNNAMDFDDLLANAVTLFEKDRKVLSKYQERFQYIMVDEYQDTNQTQYKFIRMLAEPHKNLCVVGDDDQCIYQWRGADIRNILEFEKDFKDTKVIKLEENYRSTANILDAAHSVVKNNEGRKDKKLWTRQEPGEKLIYRRVEDGGSEAAYIAGEIEQIVKNGGEYKDIAILYRINAQSRAFEEYLSGKKIPYRVLGGLRYYERKEIKDIMSYLALVQNNADDLALERIINEPKRGVGSKTIEKLKENATERGSSLFSALLDPENPFSERVRENVRNFTELIEKYSVEKDSMRISDLYDTLLEETGYLRALQVQKTLEAESRIENLLEFKSVITAMESDNRNITLEEFMEKIALLADVDNHNSNENAVVLLTLHSAKGLEFPYVFMPGLEDGLFPGWRSLGTKNGLEEERRLCYVGITRAKKKLWLTSARERMLYGRINKTRESQFLGEIDPDLVDGEVEINKNRESIPVAKTGRKSVRVRDQLRYTKPKKHESDETFTAGEIIIHPNFGEGKVLSQQGNTINVVFEDKTRKIAIGYVPITKKG